MISHASERFWKSYQKLPFQLKSKAREVYVLGKKNSSHKILHFKQIHSDKQIFSVRITMNYRVLGVRNDEFMVWFWIGSQDDFNKMIAEL